MSKVRINQVKRIVEKWKPILGLDHWEFNYSYTKAFTGEAANIVTTSSYLRSHITIFEELFKPYNPLEKIIVHEMCHVLTEPSYSIAVDFYNGKHTSLKDIEHFREVSTESIARAVLRAKGVKW